MSHSQNAIFSLSPSLISSSTKLQCRVNGKHLPFVCFLSFVQLTLGKTLFICSVFHFFLLVFYSAATATRLRKLVRTSAINMEESFAFISIENYSSRYFVFSSHFLCITRFVHCNHFLIHWNWMKYPTKHFPAWRNRINFVYFFHLDSLQIWWILT